MAVNYSRMQDLADRLLSPAPVGNGREIGLARQTPGTGPSHNPGPGTWVEVSPSPVGVVLPASKGTIQAFDNRVKSGELVDEKLRFVIIAAKGLPFEPKSGDRLTFDDADWIALGCTPLNPTGIPIYYGLGVRRS